MALNYSSKHDISYANYNNKTIPWKVNASIIYQNNQITDPSLNIGTNNNNLVIESSQNNILFITSENNNKKVIVKNNMTIKNLDVSNTLTTKLNDASSITLNNKLYLPERSVNIIGDLKVGGSITIIGSTATGLVKSESQFINVTLSGSRFTDVSIVNSNISYSDFSNVNIINSYIYNIPFGYGFDKSNNSYPNKAIFSDVSLQRLVLDSSINSYINFAANANSANSIIIRSSDDYSKLKINKPLNIGIGIGETISTISNVSIFYGTISCNTLYYSQLVPDIRLNTYFDVSIGQVSVSGNNIPVNNSFNIGSTNYKFNEIISNTFVGDLSGAVSSANDLRKNLDMSFNNLDIYGTFTLNRQNLNQFLSGDLISIVAADISFINANNKVRDLSISLYSKMDVDLCLNSNFTKISLLDASLLVLNNSITSISSDIYTRTGFDLCLNINFAKISLVDASLLVLNNSITSISASVYSKSDFDLCLNRNVLRTSDVSAILSVVTNPTRIYPMLGYIDSFSIKVTNAKVTNELAFPYAITYIDDITEDTNFRESLARIVSSQDGSIVVNATAAGLTYEANTSYQTWDLHRANAVTLGGSLAVILNATQNEQVRVVAAATNVGSAFFIGAVRTSKPNPPYLDKTSDYWQWTNGATWSYTNFGGNEPNNSGNNEPFVELFPSNGIWNDIYSFVTRPAVYMKTFGTGSFKISENNNNKSYYTSKLTETNIATSYSCIAITNDGMFVALGKATNVTVYMKNASGWSTLGDQINVDFTRYTDTCCNILWDGYDPAMYCNLQNLAINFNYNTGLTSSQLLLAFGDTRTSIKVYSYTGGTWALSNGIYSVVGGSWSTTSLLSFTTVGETTFTAPTSGTVEVLIVGGGGGGGTNRLGGGGGGGGVIYMPSVSLTAGTGYQIIVGNGGPPGSNGQNSRAFGAIAAGGGSGADGGSILANSGGSGGGSAINVNNKLVTNPGGGFSNVSTLGTNSGTIYGNRGGNMTSGVASNVNTYRSAGGGGAGSQGVDTNPIAPNVTGTAAQTSPSAGGAGIMNPILGPTYYWGGGGGGGASGGINNDGLNGGWGGIGGGGAGGNEFTTYNGIGGGSALNSGSNPTALGSGGNGGANTGGGGGGSGSGGAITGSGGSGIVVIRYNTFLRAHNATTAEINNNNFGYFVTLSQSPSVLGFTVANKFYTYNCTNSDGSQRGSVQTLPSSNGSYTNIIAFKMSSDAEKIIVSNTYYVFIYKWNINNWSLLTTINLVSAAITFTYPNTSTTPIPAGPRSLDISNISSDDCVFAIGFPDVLIDTSANRRSRGYVEYWKLTNTILTRLATLVPRKRNIDSSNVETDEYFFSGGGIKITNANTILVAPNFKFHFNNNNKNYTLATSNLDWSTHNNTSNAKSVSGREMASIENEADNELVKISARNNLVWIGGMRTSTSTNSSGRTSTDWQWSDLSSTWNYTSFAGGEPNRFSETRIQSLSGTWYDTDALTTSRAVYMTRLQYSLNTFNIFDKFFFHSSGFSSSYANTAISTTVIAKWIRMDSPSTLPIEFRGNGDLVSNGKGIFTVSDIRLKENIVDSTPKLEDLLKVRVVNYNLKGSKDNKLIGVVAQELEQLFPTLVNNGELSQHDIYLGKTESYKSVKYSCFDVILIKAFQEQVAIINKLTSQLDEIDGKTKLLKAISQDFVILKQELDLLKRENELFKLNINEILKLI